MTPAPALHCPRCKHTLGPESWIEPQAGRCFRCNTEFEFLGFPALQADKAAVAPQAAVLAEDSVCFFHAENRAEAICDGCGRLLCPVCAVPFGGKKLCPTCISANKSSGTPGLVRERVLYDGIAVSVAILPLLLWPLTLVSAPMALGLVIHGWRKPGSLVRGPSRVRFILAGLFAVGEMAAWAFFGMRWLLR